MPRRIYLAPHLTTDELQKRYRAATDPVERSHWHFLWLLAGGMTATAVAAITGYSAYWIGRIARRYNTEGPDGVRDRRHATCTAHPDLPASQLAELEAAVAGPHPKGDHWCGRTVAAWLSQHLGRQVRRQLGWRYLRRFGARWRKPRPRHVRAEPRAQAEFKQHLRPLLRAVATAFPHASVELWAVDEHRITLKPLLDKVWCLDGQRPRAPVQHRFDIRHLDIRHLEPYPQGYPRGTRTRPAHGVAGAGIQSERVEALGGANGHTTWTLVVGFPVETSG
jgi:transposase